MSPIALLLVTALQPATVDLVPGRAPGSIAEHVYVLVDESRDWTLDDARTHARDFERNTASIVNPGTTSGIVWLRVDVRNTGAQRGEWVVALNKVLLDPGEITLVRDGSPQILLADDRAAFADSYRRFGTLAGAFELDAGERARLYVRYRGANWSGMDLTLATESSIRQDTRSALLLLTLLAGGVGSLVLYGSVSFLFLGRQIVLLYALAQISLFAFYAHFSGYTTIYLWPEAPHYGRIVAPLTMVVFITAMAQFARRFFETARALPRTDRLLQVCVVTGTFAIVTLPLGYLTDGLPRRLPLFAIYAVTIVTWLVLPTLALFATFRWHRDYWPMAVAWGIMAAFMIAAMLIFSGITAQMPLKAQMYGVAVYLEALFLALAIALRTRQIRAEQQSAQQQLARSLEAELETARRAVGLAEQREWALGDLAEKGRLLLAAGHDTRQLISALQHFSLGLQRMPDGKRIEQAGRDIGEIAERLDEVLTTAIDGAASGGIADQVIALDLVAPIKILAPLRLIHGATAADAGVDLRVHATSHPLVTDRVLVSRIMGNLVTNAIRCTDEGRVVMACRRDPRGHRFQVFDSGCGIDAEALARLLDLDTGAVHFGSQAGGEAAGLHIAKQLAARVGTRIQARSHPGRGSVFEFLIPTPARRPFPSGTRVVLADTDRAQRRRVADLCATIGVDCWTPGSGAALAAAAEGIEGATVILVDLHYGGSNAGLDLCRELKAAHPAVSLVLLSYDRSIEVRRLAEGVAPVLAYLPLSREALVVIVDRALSSRGPQDRSTRRAASRSAVADGRATDRSRATAVRSRRGRDT